MKRLRITACLCVALFASAPLVGCGDDDHGADDPWEIDQPDGDQAENSDDGTPEPVPLPDPEEAPAIEVVPPHIAFPYEHESTVQSESLEIRNAGDAPLHIESIELVDGPDHFAIADIVGADDDGSATLDGGGDESVTVVVEFDDDSFEPVNGELEITSDDPTTSVKTVDISGNAAAPCIDVTTSQFDFGAVAIGHATTRLVSIQNCSLHSDLHIEDVDVADGDAAFSLVDSTTGEVASLAPGNSLTFLTQFSPDDAGVHQGQLDIFSDSPDEPVRPLYLMGEGVDADCATVDALGAPEATDNTTDFDDSVEVEAGQSVKFKADLVDDAGHDDLTYEWTLVERPEGSLDDLMAYSDDDRVLHANSLGDYVVQLVAYDEDGVASCEPSTVHVVATTDEDIHIQLTWISPLVEAAGGVDSNVQRGVDLDLHYVRPGGDWGDMLNSVFWHSDPDGTGLSWGDGEVRMDIDDLWGEAPENIFHDNPEQGVHHVGVHLYRDYCWAPTDATVRVYFKGDLVFEDTRRLYDTDNFWLVGDVDWGDDPAFVEVDDIADDHELPSHWDITSEGSC